MIGKDCGLFKEVNVPAPVKIVWRGGKKWHWDVDHLYPFSLEGNCGRFWKTLLNGGGGIFRKKLLRMRDIPTVHESTAQEMLLPPPFRSVTKGEKYVGGRRRGVWGGGGKRGKIFIIRKRWRPPNGDTLSV